jgi:hypothetical protein
MSTKPAKVIGSNEDVERMDHIQREIEKVIVQYRHNTEVLIMIGALMRVVRLLVSLYPYGIRQSLIADNVAYLNAARSDEGRDKPTSGLGPNFWLPPGSTAH